MLRIQIRRFVIGLGAIALIMAVVSLMLSYFFPAPPSTVTLATAFRGASFDYYGRRYRDRLARDHIKLELKETPGAVENLKLLQDPRSGVDAAFIAGGISNGKQAPGLLSLGIIYHNAFWVFYSSSLSIEHLQELKGKRVAVGPVGSATRQAAERILGLAGVSESTAAFLPFAGIAAADALNDGKVDVVWILGALEVPAVQALLKNPKAKLLSFEMAEAYTRIYPDLVQLTLPRGVLDIERNIPPGDVFLIANVNRVLVRSDLHPEIVYHLSKTMLDEHSEPGIFARPGEFPKVTDPEFPLHASAVEYYRNGPSLMQRHVPLWLYVHTQRLIAVIAAVVAVIIPLFHYVPILYRWTVRRRLLHWYARLQALEASIESNHTSKHLAETQIELQQIDEAVSRIHFPLAFSDQLYNLRSHIEMVRRRTRPRESVPLAAE